MSNSRSRSRSFRSERRSRSRSPPRRNGYRNDRENPEPCECLGFFNLPKDMSKEELERQLDDRDCPYSEIKLIKDHNDPHRSKGYAFVEYQNISLSTKAKQKFNGIELGGKTLRVDFSVTNNRRNGPPHRGRSPPRRSPYSRRYSPPRRVPPKFSREAAPNHCLAVFNLPKGVDEKKLEKAFDTYGPIEKVKVVRDHATGESKKFGFIWFEHKKYAIGAHRDMDGFKFSKYDENGVRVDFSLNEDRGGRRRSPPPRSSYRSRSRSMSR